MLSTTVIALALLAAAPALAAPTLPSAANGAGINYARSQVPSLAARHPREFERPPHADSTLKLFSEKHVHQDRRQDTTNSGDSDFDSFMQAWQYLQAYASAVQSNPPASPAQTATPVPDSTPSPAPLQARQNGKWVKAPISRTARSRGSQLSRRQNSATNAGTSDLTTMWANVLGSLLAASITANATQSQSGTVQARADFGAILGDAADAFKLFNGAVEASQTISDFIHEHFGNSGQRRDLGARASFGSILGEAADTVEIFNGAVEAEHTISDFIHDHFSGGSGDNSQAEGVEARDSLNDLL
ncbi:hypothetical protein BXZ70DRAFT_1067913 [Cristinia sonorae]|uniref:Uncharacterized protein n=1 Tax=Cristinia sonorae TaxID=1940300 RepID=A0A8K0UFH8_9AGAR|nr:hypothetical protein BXZ70DRAFT_1067913 [Cristinia sonorae]